MSFGRALLVAALALLPGFTQEPRLSDRAEAAVGRSGVSGGRLGILIYSTQTEAPVYDRDAKKVCKLASNTKLITTACAIAKLGPGYRFRTTLAWDESGDLHVFGAGDPLIGGRLYGDDPTKLFRDAAARLKEAGQSSFAGRLVLHPGIFDDVTLHPAWIEARYDQDAWWCAPVGGLSFNDNCVDLIYEGGAGAGEAVRVTARPETKFVSIENRAETVPSRPKDFGFVRKNGTNRIIANGELAVGAKPRVAWVAIKDPARYFGTVLRETLAREGIAVAGEVAVEPGLGLETRHMEILLAEHSLEEVVKPCNTVSQNLYAEMILKLLGFRFRGVGSTAAGIDVVQEFLRNDVGVTDVELVDGCGLARENRASAESIVALLRYMRKHRHGRVFAESLAVAGVSGTLKERMESTGGRVHAKTGSISGVSCLSGYAENSKGETFIFSILANDWRKGAPRQLQDALGELLAK
jgi:D-alanyl-D-alanine carboxypeptidase/D-alanyl-D-alanine-endopeptidase (penicillin-binding protein 4)